MQNAVSIRVTCGGRSVGILARTRDGRYPFEYSDEWIAQGFPLNPLSLPLEKRLFMPDLRPLNGMFGVFDDSLPDGWGRLLVDRMLVLQGEDPAAIDCLNRLAIVGSSGMGALCYEPEYRLGDERETQSDLDSLAREAQTLLAERTSDDLDELFELGGSSGGARPKILTQVDGEEWIIKFPSSLDKPNIGEQEYRYALCAKECGISMPEVRLFPSRRCSGYFGVKRFDRSSDGRRIHMVSASGMLETTHRTPNLDYRTLVKLTQTLTDDMAQSKALFKLMCFNVFAHNRDDHGKNFSYLFDDGAWRLAPAYDLTYSSSIGGEHATTVSGNGKDPGVADILAVADYANISPVWAKSMAKEIQEKTQPLITAVR